jgi:hypothetical protein
MATTSNTLCCFFCGRDLSMAQAVQYVAEGPCCSMCLSKMHVSHAPIRTMDEYRRKIKGSGDWFLDDDYFRVGLGCYPAPPEDE